MSARAFTYINTTPVFDCFFSLCFSVGMCDNYRIELVACCRRFTFIHRCRIKHPLLFWAFFTDTGHGSIIIFCYTNWDLKKNACDLLHPNRSCFYLLSYLFAEDWGLECKDFFSRRHRCHYKFIHTFFGTLFFSRDIRHKYSWSCWYYQTETSPLLHTRHVRICITAQTLDITEEALELFLC